MKKIEKKKFTKQELLEMLLEQEEKEIRKMDDMVDLLINKNISINVNRAKEETLTFGEKMADNVARFAGSWGFIIIFFLILILWMLTNLFWLDNPYDKYPFILLNLLLSTIAALQAPIIMMSQNRQEKKDRLRSDNDYKIDLKAEFILEDMHHKFKLLIENQEQLKNKLNAIEKELNK